MSLGHVHEAAPTELSAWRQVVPGVHRQGQGHHCTGGRSPCTEAALALQIAVRFADDG